MTEEVILLLVKEKRYDEAIRKYVEQKKFAQAEEFCDAHKSLGLLTTLLTIYFDLYKQCMLSNRSSSIRAKQNDAEQYRTLALRLMQSHSSKN